MTDDHRQQGETSAQAPTPRDRRTARLLLGRIRSGRLAGWLFGRALAPGRRPRSRHSGWGAMGDRLLTIDPISASQRAVTTEVLVELFFEIVAASNTERFIEAGAKDAAASRRAATLASVNQVTAFEANPFTYRRFAASLAESGVRYEQLALSHDSTELEFYVRLTADGRPSADGQGSIYERSDYQPGHRTVTVPAVSLDAYLAGQPAAPSALWIDVEGALEAVLTGASGVLSQFDVVLAEVEERPYWNADQWLRGQVDEFLEAFDLVPVARDQQSRYQYNVLYVRTSHLDAGWLHRAFDRWRYTTRSNQCGVTRAG